MELPKTMNRINSWFLLHSLWMCNGLLIHNNNNNNNTIRKQKTKQNKTNQQTNKGVYMGVNTYMPLSVILEPFFSL